MAILKIFISQRIMMKRSFLDGALLIDENGKIAKIIQTDLLDGILKQFPNVEVIDVKRNIIMPGLIDSHVHVNEPGRTEWEGFETATKAAAAGGFTTIIDMPLNSIPPTTNVENFKEKIKAASGQCYVNVGFWGGFIGENINDLEELQEAGVVGFKCFMCNSGVHEFPQATLKDVQIAIDKLKDRSTVLAFHAEVDTDQQPPEEDPTLYETFLKSRPDSMELDAIRDILSLDLKNSKTLKLHIVHLSTAQAVPLIDETKRNGKNISVETCHHYLNLTSEEVPKGATQFKCTPPIRDSKNQDSLWKALLAKQIDLVVSDHSPCTPDQKLPESGDFMRAWGGISSVQFGLSLFWTQLHQRNLSVFLIAQLLSRGPAKLVDLDKRKGNIEVGYDADLTIWNDEQQIKIEESTIWHKHKTTPYMGKKLLGEVLMTVVGGKIVYDKGDFSNIPMGKILTNNNFM